MIPQTKTPPSTQSALNPMQWLYFLRNLRRLAWRDLDGSDDAPDLSTAAQAAMVARLRIRMREER